MQQRKMTVVMVVVGVDKLESVLRIMFQPRTEPSDGRC